MDNAVTEALKALGQQGVVGAFLILALGVIVYLAKQLLSVWRERLDEQIKVLVATTKAVEKLSEMVEKSNVSQEGRAQATQESIRVIQLLAKDIEAHRSWAQVKMDEVLRAVIELRAIVERIRP